MAEAEQLLRFSPAAPSVRAQNPLWTGPRLCPARVTGASLPGRVCGPEAGAIRGQEQGSPSATKRSGRNRPATVPLGKGCPGAEDLRMSGLSAIKHFGRCLTNPQPRCS